jgi:fucose permease
MSRLPALVEQTRTDFAGIGLALVALGAGTLMAMSLTGPACFRYGSRRVLITSFGITFLSLIAIGLSRSPGQLATALLCSGIGSGAWDAAMNVQGYAVELHLKKHLMSRFHGWWSIGSMAGAGLGISAARFSVPLPAYLAGVGLLAAVLCAVAMTSFVDEKTAVGPDQASKASRSVVRRLVPIGVVIVCGATVEGAAGDWLAIYLHEERDFSHTGAAAGYALFVTAMAVGRLVAERPHHHIGPVAVVRIGALVAGAAVALTVLTTAGGFAYVGALGWGAGICSVFPSALSATGNAATPAAVATMTTIGYSASIVSPPAIGWLAHAVGLGTALLALLPLALVVAWLAASLGEARSGTDEKRPE